MSIKKIGSSDIEEIQISHTQARHDIIMDLETYLHWDYIQYRPYLHDEEDDEIRSLCYHNADPRPYLIGLLMNPLKELELPKTRFEVSTDEKGREIYTWLPGEIGNLIRIFTYCCRIKRVPRVWFHNTGYDLPILASELKAIIPDLRCYFSMKDNGDFIYGRMESKELDFVVEFKDTMLFKRDSLEEISETLYEKEEVDKKKGSINYNKTEVGVDDTHLYFIDYITGEYHRTLIEQELRYLRTDLTITADYKDKLEEDLKSLIREFFPNLTVDQRRNLFDKATTASRLSQWMFNFMNGSKGKWDILEEKYKPILDEQVYDDVENSNLGGYTAYNKECIKHVCSEDEEISYFDVNSMYPTVLTGLVPYGDLLDTPPKGTYLTWYVLDITKCVWKEKYRFFSRKPLNERVIRAVGRVKNFYLPQEDFEFLQTMADIEYRVVKKVYQKTDYAMRDFMNMLYEKRSHFKEMQKLYPEDSSDYKYYKSLGDRTKLMMNSTYGRLGLKVITMDTLYNVEELNKKDWMRVDIEYRSCLTGVFITARARTILLRKVKEFVDNDFTIFYVDTDSVMFLCRDEQKALRDSIMGQDTGRLGEWKDECDRRNEGRYNMFLGMGVCKKYFLGHTESFKSKFALSGVKKIVHKIFKKKLKEDPDKTMSDMKYIFSKHNNVVFIKSRNHPVIRSDLYKIILSSVDIQTHNLKKTIDARVDIDIENMDYKLTVYEKEEQE